MQYSQKIYSVSECGMEGLLVEVECHLNKGLPGTVIVGMASKAVDESKERLKAAFASSGLSYPKKRITLNLAPADEPKESASLDLPMAVSILASDNELPLPRPLDKLVFFGELALDGNLRPVRGLIGKLLAAKKHGFIGAIVPIQNLAQAQLVPGIAVKGASSLHHVASWLFEKKDLATKALSGGAPYSDTPVIDIGDVIGHFVAKRALEIAAAGGHNLLMNGPPGTGKTMLAKTIVSILPELSPTEIAETTHIHSLAGLTMDGVVRLPPFRSPHHTASSTAIIGGGQRAKPGEISLAHHGVLLLDELPEYHRDCLEALRQPLEDHVVHISRVKQSMSYPAEFLLIATRNPCPCGFFGTKKPCNCSAYAIEVYNKKLSGPIMDRIDLHTDVEDIDYASLGKVPTNTAQSNVMRQRVTSARSKQQQRNPGGILNSNLTNRQLAELKTVQEDSLQLLRKAADNLSLSARAFLKTLRVAQTIADLNNEEVVTALHIAEALQFRPRIS